jgi:heterodisulfide reductase subunit A-like polyferredoxin
MKGKPRFLLCVCRGDCPGFAELDIWKFLNYVRNELDVEYAIVHPQMCVDDGDRFWKDYAKQDKAYIVAACDPKMQRKMYKDALIEVGADFDKQVFPIDLRNTPTEQAMQKIKAFVEEVTQKLQQTSH